MTFVPQSAYLERVSILIALQLLDLRCIAQPFIMSEIEFIVHENDINGALHKTTV